jgi:hypothetical protein
MAAGHPPTRLTTTNISNNISNTAHTERANTRTTNGAQTSLRQSKLHRGIATTNANRKKMKASQGHPQQHGTDDVSEETNHATSKTITRNYAQPANGRSNITTWGGGNHDSKTDQNNDETTITTTEQENTRTTDPLDDTRTRTPI